MSETQPDEQPQAEPEAPEPEASEAPADEPDSSAGDAEPQVGRRPDFVGEEGEAGEE